MDKNQEKTKKTPVIVAVDGPAGSGKSSVCARVCQLLGWHYINTGYLYRALGYMARQQGVSFREDTLPPLIADFSEGVHWEASTQSLWYRDQDLTPFLNTVDAGRDASDIAKIALVRQELLPLQRKLALSASKGAMVDGRDIGTVVFPDADLKIYMTASLEERARRRWTQLKESNKLTGHDDHDFEQIKSAIAARDEQDKGRGNAPLKMADEAIRFDTSQMEVGAAVEAMLSLLKKHHLY